MTFNYDKIFITGATGWLGRQVVKTLTAGDPDVLENFKPTEHNYSVRAMTLAHELETASREPIFSKIDLQAGSVTDAASCQKFFQTPFSNGLLIHIAGIIHPKTVADFYKINLEGTKNLIEAAEKAGIKKVVVISSNSPIGCNPNNQHLFDESAEYNPYMNYGKSKMQMELFLKSKMATMDITIIRPPWFYGENQPERQMTFYTMVRDGKFPFVGDGTNLRSKANVKNITQGILLAASNPKSRGEIYWIADKKAYSMNEIIQTIGEVLDKEFGIKPKPNKLRLPFFAGQIAEKVDAALQSIGIYQQKIHVLSEMNKSIACDVSKAERELGYSPKVDLYKGVKDALYFNDEYKKLI